MAQQVLKTDTFPVLVTYQSNNTWIHTLLPKRKLCALAICVMLVYRHTHRLDTLTN